jgi:hypothetical protein
MNNIKIDSTKEILFLENYLSKHSSYFLSTAFNNSLTLRPRGILSGPSTETESHKINSYHPVIPYTGDKSMDLAIDMISMICPLVSLSVSEYAKKDLVLKSMFYSVMRTGTSNSMHMDNFEYKKNKTPKLKEDSKYDYSAILYLNEDFTGGELIFPNQGITIYPKTGSIAIFKGDDTTPHEVSTVLSGTRVSIAMFFWPRELANSVLVD